MKLSASLLHFLVFPGLCFAIPAAWLFLWGERKAVAKMQRRIGPPLLQAFYDFMKLMGKHPPKRIGLDGKLMKLWPGLSVIAMLAAIGLLPVFPKSGGFPGDWVLLVTLLELPSIFIVLAGLTSGSLYAQIGSTREAVLGVSTNLVFLMSVVMIAVSKHTFRIADLAVPAADPAHWLGVVGILLCIPAKLHLNPFSTTKAEQEIYAGPLTEYAGVCLAQWELAHGLEWVGLTGLVSCLILPRTGEWWLDAPLFVLTSFVLVLLMGVVSAGTARLTLKRSIQFYWRWALVLAILAVSSAALMRLRQ